QIKTYIAQGNLGAVEDAWLAAMEAHLPPAQMTPVLELLTASKNAATADTLAGMLLADAVENLPPGEALDLARAVLPAVGGTSETRQKLVALYQKVYADRPELPVMLRLSGLEATQSLRRGIRTLDLALSLRAGAYLINRFDHRAARLERFDDVLEQYEVHVSDGERLHLEPKLLADEFDPAGADDFRILAGFDGERLAALCQDDPAAVLIAVCNWRGKPLTADQIKDVLVPRHVPADAWSKWWSRARTAAKRCSNLSIEGRSPVMVSYHPGGRTLEAEMQSAVEAAKVPLETLGVIRQYARELGVRRQAANTDFLGPILAGLAAQADTYRTRRPADALVAAMALEEAARLGLPTITKLKVTSAAIVSDMDRPAQRIAMLTDAALRARAIEGLAARPDAPEHLLKLMRMLSAAELDDVAGRLRAAGQADTVATVVTEALADPAEHIQVCIWLWRGPAEKPAGAPDRLDTLTRLLKAAQDLANDHEVARETRREAFEQIRWALTADDCRAFREVVKSVNEAVAATLKRRVERNPGLTDVNREKMLAVLREEYFSLFLKGKVDPWADENILWATEGAIARRREELKHLLEIELPENSRAIGVAAAKGDLSENSEWQFAVEEQRRLNSRVSGLQNELNIARALTVHDVPATSVGIGSRVTLDAPQGRVDVTILGPWESDAPNRVYSYQTPVALAMLGHNIGDLVTVKLDGEDCQCTIAAVRPWI
ncbi:MAG: GreA/GreB family elongation factor, partial [Planctomycetota bacterium]|nr:GreA/GreB family elongation factor [Planctomycetota bacterium]